MWDFRWFRSLFREDERMFVELVRRTWIPPEDVLTLYSSPVVIVPAIKGHSVIPRWTYVRKPAGTGYTLGTATKFQVKLQNDGGIGHEYAFTGMIDQNNQETILMRGPGSSSFQYGPGWGVTGALEDPLELTNDNADLTGGDTGLLVIAQYLAIPE